MNAESDAPILLLMGPTAAGKTDIALALAERLPIEIVSVDSALVYRGLDIGTGKPDAAVRARIPHHLIDLLDPSASYSAGQFATDAVRLIREIRARGRMPILVGGTMLYFRALTRGIAALPPATASVRAEIDALAARIGWPSLHRELAQLDPTAAARIQPNDSQRIQRALEVIRVSGKTLTELQAKTLPPDPTLRFQSLALSPPDRAQLYDRIEVRFNKMMEHGFAEEVRRLFERGDLHSGLPAIRSVGYRQLWQHFEGKFTLKEAVTASIVATRHLARRQLIWLRGEPAVEWCNPSASDVVERLVERLNQFPRCRPQY